MKKGILFLLISSFVFIASCGKDGGGGGGGTPGDDPFAGLTDAQKTKVQSLIGYDANASTKQYAKKWYIRGVESKKNNTSVVPANKSTAAWKERIKSITFTLDQGKARIGITVEAQGTALTGQYLNVFKNATRIGFKGSANAEDIARYADASTKDADGSFTNGKWIGTNTNPKFTFTYDDPSTSYHPTARILGEPESDWTFEFQATP